MQRELLKTDSSDKPGADSSLTDTGLRSATLK